MCDASPFSSCNHNTSCKYEYANCCSLDYKQAMMCTQLRHLSAVHVVRFHRELMQRHCRTGRLSRPLDCLQKQVVLSGSRSWCLRRAGQSDAERRMRGRIHFQEQHSAGHVASYAQRMQSGDVEAAAEAAHCERCPD